MPGGEKVPAVSAGGLAEQLPFDQMVAADAWVRRPSREVFAGKIVGDETVEYIGQVNDMVHDAQPPGSLGRMGDNGIPVTGFGGGNPHGISRHLEARFDQKRRGNRAVDTAAHGDRHPS